jgi:hypothetical protein
VRGQRRPDAPAAGGDEPGGECARRLDDELAGLEALGVAGWLLKPPAIGELAALLAQAMRGK